MAVAGFANFPVLSLPIPSFNCGEVFSSQATRRVTAQFLAGADQCRYRDGQSAVSFDQYATASRHPAPGQLHSAENANRQCAGAGCGEKRGSPETIQLELSPMRIAAWYGRVD